MTSPFSDTCMNFFFIPGKLSVSMDSQSGSSGKGKLGAFIGDHANNWQFACCTYFPNAGHWRVDDDGGRYFYQTFNSCAARPDKYEKLYIGPGACIELPSFHREKEQNNIPAHKIGISPLTSILQDIDGGYERGTHDFNGIPEHGCGGGGPLVKTGTTAHGCGANRARRVLRRPEALYAKDVPELKEFICDVPFEIMDRMERGQAGLLEIAQGFQLSLMSRFFPFCTSRNCTVAAGFDDMMLPVVYAGNVILNFRTFPIRISNFKYIGEGGKHLTWDEVQDYERTGKKYEKIEGNSGPGYDDQEETTWDKITQDSGSPTSLMEMTSVTKLPRRVFSFSRKNVEESVRHNRTVEQTYLAVNFVNYLDYELTGQRESLEPGPTGYYETGSKVLGAWLQSNIPELDAQVVLLGTGAKTDDYIMLNPYGR